MNNLSLLMAAAAALLVVNVGVASGDEYDPDPNRLPGPKHFDPASCKRYPEVCKARNETLRRQYQDCIDSGRGDCAPPPGRKKAK